MRLTDLTTVVGYHPILVSRVGDFRAGVFLSWLLQERAGSDPTSRFTVAGASRLTALTAEEVRNAALILSGKAVVHFAPQDGSDWISFRIAFDHEVFS